MTSTDMDVKQFLARQRAAWDKGAEGWLKWRHVFAQRTDDQALVEASGVKPGDLVLDVGTGTGDPALALAQAVGLKGRVVATDLSEVMLDVARRRADDAGLTNMEFRVSAAEDLDFVENSFDAVVSSFTLMLVADPGAAVRRIHGVLRPGGRVALSVWATPDKVPMLAMPAQIIFSELGISPPPPGTPGLFALGGPGQLQGTLEKAGFTDVSVEPLPFTFRYDSADEYGTFTREVAIVLTELVEQHAPERQDEIWAKVTAFGRDRAEADGSLTFENQALIGTGVRGP